MNNMGEMYTCMNPQPNSSDYNNMSTNGDGDDSQSSLDPDDDDDRCPSVSSPSRSLLKVRFL
jgi:hypothetical protein